MATNRQARLHSRQVRDRARRHQCAGWISSVEGGHATSGRRRREGRRRPHRQHKHIAGVKYEDISVSCGTGCRRRSTSGSRPRSTTSYARKDGAIITADYNHEGAVGASTSSTALITEVGFPALDAASKDAAKMTIKFTPEYTRCQGEDRRSRSRAARSARREQKKWLPVELPSQDRRSRQPAPRVNKIEALTVKQKVVENPVGEHARLREGAGAASSIPNLVITLRRVARRPVLRLARGLRHQGQQRRGQGAAAARSST